MFLCVFEVIFWECFQAGVCIHPSIFDIITEWKNVSSPNPEVLTGLIVLRIMDILSFHLNKSFKLPKLGF